MENTCICEKLLKTTFHIYLPKKCSILMKIDFIFEKMQQQKSMSVTLIDRKVVMMLAVRNLRRKTFKHGSLYISLNKTRWSFSVIEYSYHVIDFYHTLLNLFSSNTSSVAKKKLIDSKKN